MIKHWRLILLLVTVLGAIFAIGLKAYPYGREGVEVLYVSAQSPAKNIIQEGMIITSVNGMGFSDAEQWRDLTADLEDKVTLVANLKEYEVDIGNSTSLGIEVMDIEKNNLDFGLDLRGGTRIILEPEDKNTSASMIEQVMGTLQTRANLYGLREIKFSSIQGTDGYFIQVEAAGIGRQVVEDLLSSQGKFEARITKPVELEDSVGEFQLGSDMYNVETSGNGIIINGTSIEENGTFTLEGMDFRYINRTEDALIFLADVLDGDDVEIVFSDPQHSGLVPLQGGGYRFYFTIQISSEGAQKFAEVTAGVPRYIDINSGDEYLKDTEILLYLDGDIVSTLRISAELQGQAISTPQITGYREDKEGAVDEKLRLQTVLRSGALPTKLETASVDVISPTLGAGFLSSAVYAAVLAAAVVMVIIFIRYRKIKVAVPLVLTGLSEVIIILGIASTNDSGIWLTVLAINILVLGLALWKKQEIDIYAWVGAILIPLLGMMTWTIDLAAIGGIIAAIGTGMDQLIVISDETLTGVERKVYTVKEKIKRAFFIIFGAASTTIAAMLPLMFLGIGLVRGFAITTIVGVLIGLLITRPAYARVVENAAGE